MYRKIQRFWGQESSLFVLLIILSIHMFIVLPFGQATPFGRVIFFVFYLFLLSAGVRYLFGIKRFRVVIILALISIAILSTHFFTNKLWISELYTLCIMLYCVLLAWIVLLKTFSAGPITVYRIVGSIVVYLLIGLCFANLYYFIFQLKGESAFRGLQVNDLREFLYFSLTTLTTVGYGDISPAIPVTRSIANIESLLGQLYPAILIARLVSMEITDRGGKGVNRES